MESFSSFHKQHTQGSFFFLWADTSQEEEMTYRQADLRQIPQAFTRLRCHIHHKTSSKSLFLRSANISECKSLEVLDRFYWKWHSVLRMESLSAEANINRVLWTVFCFKPQCILQATSNDGEDKHNTGHSTLCQGNYSHGVTHVKPFYMVEWPKSALGDTPLHFPKLRSHPTSWRTSPTPHKLQP